ncbi:MAG TPA: hypothetical protein VK461_11605 [Acidimicrobiales bacterium]|nr:hypothetical protein [Acidimicrobiales bacterium]
MTSPSPWRRLVALGLACAAVMVFVSACGDDSGSSSSATTAASAEGTDAPEDVIVSDATVTAGLNQSMADMKSLAEGVANGTATDDQFEDAHEGWESYEGTVKKNNPEAYLGLEDALAAMQKAIGEKDADAAQKASDDFTADATAYLANNL